MTSLRRGPTTVVSEADGNVLTRLSTFAKTQMGHPLDARRFSFAVVAATIVTLACVGSTDLCACPPVEPWTARVVGSVFAGGPTPVSGATIRLTAATDPTPCGGTPVFRDTTVAYTAVSRPDGGYSRSAIAYDAGPYCMRVSARRTVVGVTDSTVVPGVSVRFHREGVGSPDSVLVLLAFP